MHSVDIHFKDKVVLISGSSRGIGRHLAIEFGKLHAIVIVNYLKSKRKALKIVREINENGGRASAIKADVSKIKEVKTMCQRIMDNHSAIDILINNAGGVFENIDWTKHNSNSWSKTIDVNLTGVFNCIHTIAPIMISQKSGRILNISSLRSMLGATDIVAYAAAKAGANNLTKSYAKILGPNVNVNSLVLGRIDNDNEVPTENLIGRSGNYKDVFSTVSFLTSPESDFITGQTLVVDGGASLK